MTNFKLQPDPTFKAKVRVPVAGAAPAEVVFTFKHRSKSDFDRFMAQSEGRPDADFLLDIAEDWDLADAFTRENLELLVQNYGGAAVAISSTYVTQLSGVGSGAKE